jgi:hypothetical protein
VKDPVRVPASPCPTCGTELDGAANVHGPSPLPEPGDLTVCIECAALLTYSATLSLVALPENEAPPELLDIQRAVRELYS